MSMPRTLGVLAILAVLVGAWLAVTGSASQAAAVSPPEQPADPRDPIQLLRSDVDGIVLGVEVAGFESGQETVDGVVYDVLTIPGFGSSSMAGSPQVPGRRILLGIPLGADYQLRVSAQESEAAPGLYRLLPAPAAVLLPDPASGVDPAAFSPGTAGWEYEQDERVYSAAVFYPQAVANIAGTGFIRDQRYVAVQVNPLQYNPVTGEVVLYRRFTVEIDFTYRGRGPEPVLRRAGGSFEPVLASSLLNHESALNWRGQPSGVDPPAERVADLRDAALPPLKMTVDGDGIYQVTAADLVALGVPVDGTPATTYKLYYRGREVPIRVFESAGGDLASLWFYGEKARTKYTDTNVYWLTYDPAPLPGAEPGLRMPVRSVPPTAVPISTYYSTTIRLEENYWYRSRMPWAAGLDPDPWDHWFWTYTWYPLTDPAHPPNLALPLQLNSLSPTPSYSAMLRASFAGWTRSAVYPDHCLEFYVNGHAVTLEPYLWDGRYTEQVVSFAFDGSYLLEGANTVEARACATAAASDITFYDWFELEVRRTYQAEDDSLAFDVAEAGWQYRLGGFLTDTVELFDISGTYTVSHLVNFEVSSASSPYSVTFYDGAAQPGTRYLALTHDRLKSPLSIVQDAPSNLADPANQADYIIIAPEEFIPYVQPLVTHRAGQGLAVQVVGLEPIFDEFNYGIYSPEAIRDFLAYAYHNWSGDPPSYVLLVGDGTYDYKDYLGDGNPNLLPPYLAWVDPWIGETAADNRYVTVAGDDPFPDMHIGRLPAETAEQVSAMVDKILSYETNPAPRDWIERVLFVTDDPDLAGDFYAYSDDLVENYLPEPYVPIKAYYESTCLTGAACKQVILDTLNTTGALLVNYIGHGGQTLWAGYPEIIWRIDDLSSLAPTVRFPVMLPMTCWEGAFHMAEIDVLAEATVRLDGKGAVASWSATGEGIASGHDYLNKGFLQAVLYDGVRELGAAADVGKAQVFATGHYTDLLETYHLFGDPALQLNSLPVVDVAVGQTIEAPAVPLPSDLITITLAFTNTGPDVAAGGRLTDLLPIELVNPVVTFTSPEVLAQQEGITFAWTIDDLLPGTSGTIVVEATVDPGLPFGSDISFFNQARIAVQTHDLEPRNNVSWAGVNLKSVYLPLILKGFRP
jgi:uncharacterized repeat protein (TIGR01451 family)